MAVETETFLQLFLGDLKELLPVPATDPVLFPVEGLENLGEAHPPGLVDMEEVERDSGSVKLRQQSLPLDPEPFVPP